MTDVNSINELYNTVESMTRLVSTYGLAIVISVIVVILGSIYVFKSIKNTRDLTNKLIEDLINDKNKKETSQVIHIPTTKDGDIKEKAFDIYRKFNSTLNNICKEFVNSTGIKKITIYVFHNGNESLYGLPYYKVSCIGEHSSMMENINFKSSIPLHTFSDLLDVLFVNGHFIKEDINTIRHSDQLLLLLNSASIDSFGVFNIESHDGKMIGFTIIENNTKDNNVTIESLKPRVETLNNSIGDLIYEQYIKPAQKLIKG